MLLSSPQYYLDRGITPFMQTYLGVSAMTDNVAETRITGSGNPNLEVIIPRVNTQAQTAPNRCDLFEVALVNSVISFYSQSVIFVLGVNANT